MTAKDKAEYRKQCPYDAMGDFSALLEKKDKKENVLELKISKTEN